MEPSDSNESLIVDFDAADENVTGPCSCCGNMTRVVWGNIIRDGHHIAAYYVQWTPGKLEHNPNVDLIVGDWGKDSNEDRFAVSLSHWVEKNSWMVIDAADRPVKDHSLVGKPLSRDEVIGTELADYVFALVDTIYLLDDRIAELR
jgi:hypothetical protein